MKQFIKDRSTIFIAACACFAVAAYFFGLKQTTFSQVVADKIHDQFHSFKASFSA
jgi:hypothetical protein